MNSSGYPDATDAAHGLMSAEDKAKLDGIPEGGGGGPIDTVTQGNGLSLASSVLAMGAADASNPGAMSAADFSKLAALPTAAALSSSLAAISDAIPVDTSELPDSSNRRYVTDAQRTVIGNTSGANTGDVTVSSPTGWLSRVGQALTFALVAASGATAGVIDGLAQAINGVKTFAAEAVFSAGLVATGVRSIGAALLLRTDLGAGSTDQCVVIGPSTLDGSVNASAKIAVFATGAGTGTQVDKLWMLKSGRLVGDGGWQSSLGSNVLTASETVWRIARGNGPVLSINEGGGGSAQIYWGGSGSFYGLEVSQFFMAMYGPVRLNTNGVAKPTANSTNRGSLWYSKSASGAADTIEICLKSAADTYSWVTIGTG